jgi:phosphatidylglycerophosphate synthase
MKYAEIYEAVKKTYTPEKRKDESDDPYTYWLYRPMASFITPVFYILHISANGATLISLLLAFALIPLALYVGTYGFLAIAASSALFQILDCVDGSLARIYGTSGKIGKMLDSVSSQTFWLTFMISAGILAQTNQAGTLAETGGVAGLCLGLTFLYQRQLEDMLSAVAHIHVTFAPPQVSVGGKTRRVVFNWSLLGKLVEQSYITWILILAGLFGLLDWYFWGIVIYQGTLYLIWILRYVRTIRSYTGPPAV